MCHLCKTNPVYEFTNKRKLCKTCFIRYFEKKVLYTIRKFDMIKNGEHIGYKKGNDFRSVVLESILNFISEKSMIKLINLDSFHLEIDKKLINKKRKKGSNGMEPNRSSTDYSMYNKSKYLNILNNLKPNKIAINSSIDSEAEEIIKELIKGKMTNLKKSLPVEGKIIKPLYLFLDEEILLYARLKKLKFVKNKKKAKTSKSKISEFLDESEKKHPEVKRAIVNSLLEMYKK